MAAYESSISTNQTADTLPDPSGGSVSEFDATAAKVRALLAGATPSVSVTVRALAVHLRPDIQQARRNGLGWKAIAEIFAAAGVRAEPDTIRIYMRSASSTRAARAAKRMPQAPALTAAPSVSATLIPKEVGDPTNPGPGELIPTRLDKAVIAPRVR